MKKNLLSFALLVGLFASQETFAQCDPVTTINEDFNTYTELSESCWTANEGSPMVSIDGSETEKFISFYSFMSANTPGYAVTPQIVSIDGSQTITFETAMQEGSAPGNVTIQIGTLSNATDFETFTAVGEVIEVPAEATEYSVAIPTTDDTYIAFQITADGQHVAASIDNVVFETAETTCEAQETIDENFDSVEELAASCWGANEGMPLVYIDGETNKYVSFYSLMAPNTAGYLVTPPLSTIDGEHTLSFETGMQEGTAPGNVTIQIGTLSDAADFETFSAVGDLIEVPAEATEYTLTIPATDDMYIAFQIIADGQHVAASIDNVKWQTTMANDVFNPKNNFSFYPNPTLDKNITVDYNGNETGNISIYSLTGAKVFETEISNTMNINLSNLNGGIYIVQVQAGNYTEAKKLVIK